MERKEGILSGKFMWQKAQRNAQPLFLSRKNEKQRFCFVMHKMHTLRKGKEIFSNIHLKITYLRNKLKLSNYQLLNYSERALVN